jgi:hypothetical protein
MHAKITTLGWTPQQLLERLGQVRSEEWVCHIHSRTDGTGASLLRTVFATLIVESDAPWKVGITRDRWDSNDPPGTIGSPREAFSLWVQPVGPHPEPTPVLEGSPARRAFLILQDFTRRRMIDESIGSELAFEDSSAPVGAGFERGSPSFDELMRVIAELPPSRWRVTFVQHGGQLEYCQRRLVTTFDEVQLLLSENLVPQVDALDAAAARIPRFQLEMRHADGTRVPHPLSAEEVHQLYLASQARLRPSRP